MRHPPGVLLLNTCLTVRQGEANSHAKRGWEPFSDAAIRALSQRRRGLVFLLWGKPAQTKAALVDRWGRAGGGGRSAAAAVWRRE